MLSKVQEIKSKKAVTEVKTSAITHLQQRDTSCATSHSVRNLPILYILINIFIDIN